MYDIMENKQIVIFFAAIVVAFCCFPTAADSDESPRPNIVVIFADDLGYGDVSSYGATRIHTPIIDSLATPG